MLGEVRELRVGGTTKKYSCTLLSQQGVMLNDYARALFADEGFTTSIEACDLQLMEVSLPEIDLPNGGRFDQILAHAARYELQPCPLEVGPHLRLAYLDQPQGPYLTVASLELREGPEAPNGFYLRHLDDRLWLRGYESGPENIYPPDFTTFCLRACRAVTPSHATAWVCQISCVNGSGVRLLEMVGDALTVVDG